MAKRRTAKLKYFHDDTELECLRWFKVNLDGKPVGSPTAFGYGNNAQFGRALKAPGMYSRIEYLDIHASGWLPVNRTVRYLAKPDPHQCDWRCLGGKPGGDCWCQCGGSNHGRNYRCEPQ